MASRKRGRPFGTQLTLSERKERKRKSERERSREKIYIGEHSERWNRLKDQLKFTFNFELAGFLLDRFVTNFSLFLCEDRIFITMVIEKLV